MERFYAEKQHNYKTRLPPTNSNKIDLTLKLSPCGENAEEEMRLTRSSSSVAGEIGNITVSNGSHWGPFVQSLERSCSLPTEIGKRMLLERQRRVAASELDGPRHSAEGGVGSNFQISTKQENDSMIFQKTMAKEIPPRPAADTKLENPAKRVNLPNYCSLKGDVMEILRQMPSVTTIGDGPNGKRIEGLLYNYSGEGDQVSILCVCHGTFLSPSEFVMHAGGNKQVANPMKLITLCSDQYSFSYQSR